MCVPVYVQVCIHVCAHGDQKLVSSVFLNLFSTPPFFWDKVSQWPWITHSSDFLVSRSRDLPISASQELGLQTWAQKDNTPCPNQLRNWNSTNHWALKPANPRAWNLPISEHKIQPFSQLVPNSGMKILPIPILKHSTLESSTLLESLYKVCTCSVWGSPFPPWQSHSLSWTPPSQYISWVGFVVMTSFPWSKDVCVITVTRAEGLHFCGAAPLAQQGANIFLWE